jgi:Fe-S-cluster containining protein
MAATTDRAIVLNGTRPPIRISQERVYFAFASGRLTYDCITCNAQCCRGHGYEIAHGAELQQQLAISPAVRFFIDRCDAEAYAHYHVHNCAPACFFLDGNGRCTIQTDHGYDAKPETCRLFPFNHLQRVGGYLVVAPHRSLCPLDVVPADEKSDCSRHDQLLATLADHGVSADVPEAAPATGDAAALIALERTIVSLAERHLAAASYLPFAAAQVAAAAALLPSETLPPESPAAVVRRFTDLVYRVLGEAPSAEDEHDGRVVRTLTAITPALRAELLFESPMLRRPVPLSPGQIPYLLVALHALMELARRAGMRQVTCQTALRLFTAHRALLTLLACCDRVMVWDNASFVQLPFGGGKDLQRSYVNTVRALLPDAQRTANARLGQILCENVQYDGTDRIIFLKALARRLAGRLVPAQEHAGFAARLRFPRVMVQHWTLRHLSPEALMAMAAHTPKQRAGH